jgi:translocation and assembly module TamB
VKRILVYVLTFLLVLFLSLAAVLYWLAATESGLRWLVREIGAPLAGVTVERTGGTLWGGFALHGLAYRDAGTDVRLDELDVRWEPAELRRRVLHFRSIRAEGLHIVSTGEAKAEPPAWPEWTLPLEVAVDDFRLENGSLRIAAGAEPIRIDRLDAALHLAQKGLRIDRLELAMPEATAGLEGRVGFSGERPVELSTTWTLILPERLGLKGGGSITGNPQRLTVRQTLQAPVPAEVTIVLTDPLDKLAWTAEMKAPKFSPARIDPAWKPWPLTLSLQGQGTEAEALVTGNFSAEIPEAGEAHGRLRMQYREPGDIVVENLNLTLPRTGTELTLDGKVRKLRENPEFAATARWRNLVWPPDPKAAWRSPEGRLAVSGTPRDIRFDAEGKLRDRRVEAGGNIGLEPERMVFRDVRVRGAGADVAVEGVLGNRIDFTWSLKAGDLGLWVPGARGQLNSRGKLQGPRESPAAEAELAARSLRYEGNGVRDLKLNLKAGIQPDSPFAFKLSAEDLSVDGQRLNAELAGQGTRARHKLTGRIKGVVAGDGGEPKPASLDFAAEGGFRDEAWAGNLARFDFTVPPVGRWDLQRPAALTLGKAGGELGLACWGSAGAEGCLRAKFTGAGDWRLAAQLSRLPLARFRDAVPEDVAVSGVLNATADFSGRESLIEEGRLALNAEDALLEYRAGGKEVLRFRPEPLAIRAFVSGRGAELGLVAEQPGFASIRGDARLEGPLDSSRLKQAPLAGGLQMRLQSLAILDPWIRDIENLQGAFNADLGFAGTAAAPVLQLGAAVPDAGFSVPQLGIRVRNLNLQATSREGNRVALQGRAVSGGGAIRLEGEAALGDAAGGLLNLSLRGDRFLAADIPEARVLVSPDLGISFEAGKLMLKGKVAVPEASVRLPEQAGAVKPSDDVVLVGGEAPPEKAGLAVETRVDVILGDKVQVRGAGFKGRVDGHVLIEQAPKGPVLGTGQIVVHDGKYSLYGVELAISDGRLLFAHSPVDNPGLDISATRRVDSVLAGVKVLGTLRKPNATLYSDPPMSQTDILAYLVTGKPFGLASREEGGLLQGAAASLGGSAGNFLAKEIGSRLGLGGFVDISVQSSLAAQGFSPAYRAAPDTQGTALFLGRYLTPRIYVQYGMGLFQNAYVFRLRYELSKHWKIQTETGEYSGGDILYQWEK